MSPPASPACRSAGFGPVSTSLRACCVWITRMRLMSSHVSFPQHNLRQLPVPPRYLQHYIPSPSLSPHQGVRAGEGIGAITASAHSPLLMMLLPPKVVLHLGEGFQTIDSAEHSCSVAGGGCRPGSGRLSSRLRFQAPACSGSRGQCRGRSSWKWCFIWRPSRDPDGRLRFRSLV